MRYIIDTNVLVAALRSRSGASFALISALPLSRRKLVLSVPLYIEYQDVLNRPEIRERFDETEILGFLRYIASLAEPYEIFYLWRPILKDPKDDMVLELAVRAGASRIVTHNLTDFEGVEEFGVHAVSPIEFITEAGVKR